MWPTCLKSWSSLHLRVLLKDSVIHRNRIRIYLSVGTSGKALFVSSATEMFSDHLFSGCGDSYSVKAKLASWASRSTFWTRICKTGNYNTFAVLVFKLKYLHPFCILQNRWNTVSTSYQRCCSSWLVNKKSFGQYFSLPQMICRCLIRLGCSIVSHWN